MCVSQIDCSANLTRFMYIIVIEKRFPGGNFGRYQEKTFAYKSCKKDRDVEIAIPSYPVFVISIKCMI